MGDNKSFLLFFLGKTAQNMASFLVEKKRSVLTLALVAAVVQLFMRGVGNQSSSTVLRGWLTTLMYLAVAHVLVQHRRLVYCVVVTLPRDVRGAWRFSRVLKRISWADKNNLTVPKIFDMYANKNPKKVCFYYEDEKWTFKQVQDYSNRVGNYFAAKGYAKGDTVALFMENRPEYVCIWMGLNKIGVTAALVNYNLRLQPLLHCFEIVRAKAVIYGHELQDAMQEIMEVENMLTTIPVYCSGHKGTSILKGSEDFDTEVGGASVKTPIALQDMKLNDSLYYIYTSGTTGMPKAAIIKHYRFMMATNGVHFMNQVKEDDILYDSLPLYHMTGGMVGIGQALLFGTAVVIRRKFSASQFWKDCIKYNVTVAQYLGETCRYLLAQPPSPEEKLHKVRLLSGNGLRQEIWQDVVKRFGVKEVGEVYGSTEGNCNVSNIDSQVGAVGFVPRLAYPLMPMTIAKVDETTGELVRDPETGLAIKCQPNEPGELVGKIIKQHPIRDFQGYTDQASTDKKIARNVFRSGDSAFRTGDILVMDEFGYFYFKDRTGDTYRWKGENVSTTEVEAIISTHCSYKDAVVYGVKVPHTEGRAGMVAIADPNKSVDLEGLATVITKTMPGYARPLFLRLMKSMDMTGTYKMKKIRLQDEGFDLNKVKDQLYFLAGGKYVPLYQDLIDKINGGKIRL